MVAEASHHVRGGESVGLVEGPPLRGHEKENGNHEKETRVVLPRALANARVIAPRIENGTRENSRKEIVPCTRNGHATISGITFANCFF